MADFTQASISKLSASDPVGSAGRQGFAVAVSGDGNTAIIGAPFDNGGAGAAWVFTRSSGTWTQRQKLTAPDATGCSPSDLAACPQFGWSVGLSADGNTAIVGGPGDDNSSGAAWMFKWNGTRWNQQGAKLVGTGAVGSAEQGYSVALSANGTTAIVGGWADNSALGAAWVFRWNGMQWNQLGAKIVGTGTTATTNIFQGFSVALSGDGNVAIVGGPDDGIVIGPAPDYAVLDPPIGAAFVSTWSDGLWIQEAKLVGVNGSENGNGSEQGFSVALSYDGRTAVVGGPGQQTPGPGTSNATIQTCSTGATTPACKGGTLSPLQTETTVSMSNGAAWVFTLGSEVWGPQGGTMLAGTPAPSSNPGHGFSVALSDNGTTVLSGAPSDNANTGAAWAFTLSSGTSTPQKLVGSGAVGAAGQGASVALSRNGTTAIIGGALDQDATGAAWAFVQLFTLTVSDSGGGTISSSQSNIDCQTECSSSYGSGTRVTLTATPQSGYIFAGWSGACSGTGSCVVTISMAENVTATFYQAPGRTFVSGVGDDTNPCSREAPCRTFAGAIAKTTAGGEVDVLDPAGYGGATITQSVTIRSDHVEAGVLVAGSSGMIVNLSSATDRVQLEGLDFEGLGSLGGNLNGVQIVGSGTTTIIRCRINGFAGNGVNLVGASGGRAVVMDSVITDNGGGFNVAGNGGVQNTGVSIATLYDNNPNFGIQVTSPSNLVLTGNRIFGVATAISSIGGASINSFGDDGTTGAFTPTVTTVLK